MNKTTLNTLFSSETGDWSTPIDFFNRLDQEYNFTLDPCASVANATCDYYFTEQDNGLNQDWGGYSVFMNPPYGRKISKWVQKAYEESRILYQRAFKVWSLRKFCSVSFSCCCFC